jgi:peptide-methionine (S)-S-oxide reductase
MVTDNHLANKILIMTNKTNEEVATFAAGCFWGVQSFFEDMKGVIRSQVGYIGGNTVNPTYEKVCYKNTNHAEAVEIVFDNSIISFKSLVEAFFKLHDPTQLNRQGPDIGTQYRSSIFYHSKEQKEISEEVIKTLTEAKQYSKPIVTKLETNQIFYPAEQYHQKYFAKKGINPTCHL